MFDCRLFKVLSRGQRPTCDAEAVRSAGVRQDVRRRRVVLKQTLPLGEVVVSKEIQSVCGDGHRREISENMWRYKHSSVQSSLWLWDRSSSDVRDSACDFKLIQ